MNHRELSVLTAGLLATGLVTGIVAADPPRSGTEGNGLTENESATLWSRDADNYITQEEYRQRYGENRSAVHQVANGTDITFKRPPATTATWTRNDFENLDAGGPDTSVHPLHADLEDGVFIEDAHTTIFAVQPSTRGRLESGETPLYIAPDGTMHGFVEADEDVIRNIKSACVFVLPSIREGFPNTILEANACGVPSIVVDHEENGSTAVVEDGVTGFITEVSAEAIATRLVDCLTDDDLHNRLSAGARQFGKDHDWNVIVEQLEEIYSNVTQR